MLERFRNGCLKSSTALLETRGVGEVGEVKATKRADEISWPQQLGVSECYLLPSISVGTGSKRGSCPLEFRRGGG